MTPSLWWSKVDLTLESPSYGTQHSVGLDLPARETVRLQYGEYALIPLNLVVKPPEGYFCLLVPRSSTYGKRGLLMANSVGIIDPDFCGPADELGALVVNMHPQQLPTVVRRGDKLFQLLLLPALRPTLQFVSDPMGPSRGGVGSTDKE